jgi:hypothetical protein
MVDVAFFEKAAFWVNFAVIATASLTLVLSVLLVFLSNRRSALRSTELESAQAASAERAAAASQRAADADGRAAAAIESAAKAQSEAAAAVREREQLRKANVQLTSDLEREKRLRLELEELAARQQRAPVGATDSPTVQQRVLTAEQEGLLATALRDFAGKSATIIELADPEARPLARQISSALEKATWSVFITPVGALTPPQHGIICTHNTGDAAALALVSTLRSFNLIVYERNETVDRLQIIVGLRPRP